MPDAPANTGTDATADTSTDTADTSSPDTGSGDELARWKALARKHEDRAKANSAAARELDELRQKTMSETEKAVAAARDEGRKEAAKTLGARLVDAEVKIAVAGRGVNVDALLDGLDRTRFLTDDGEPDTKAIAQWVDKLVPAGGQLGRPDLGQGARGAPAGGGDMNALLRRASGRTT